MSDSKSNLMSIGYNKFNIFFIFRPRQIGSTGLFDSIFEK
jgi:hypothetical protein